MRNVEYMRLSALNPATANPKQHVPDRIAASMARFGYAEPIVLDERTGRIVAGHGRWEKLTEMEAAGAPRPDGVALIKGEWAIAVVRGWASEDDAEAHAAGIALNRLVELGGWDHDALAKILGAWDEREEALDAIGFDDDSYDDLRALLEERAELPPATESTGGAVRSIILDYPIETYDRVIELAKAARAKHGIATNAELVARLVNVDL